MTLRIAVVACLSMVLLACQGQDSAPLSQRLVDDFEPTMILGSPTAGDSSARAEWRFTEADGTTGWDVVQEIEGLTVQSNHLTGKTTGGLPILKTELASGGRGRDVLSEIHLRLRVDAGANAALHFVGERPQPVDIIEARRFFWDAEAPIIADNTMRTYVLQTPFPVLSTDVKDIYLRPSDAADARFEIESLRLVFQSELLAEKKSGIGWNGLEGIFRESVITRAPETLRWPVRVPQRPKFEVGLGTLDDEPLTFRVAIATTAGEELLFERTLTTSNRWEDVSFDLDEYRGQDVTLVFSLDGPEGTPGLWGSPMLRQRVEVAPDDLQAVILIVADTLRADHLSFHGYERPTAPHLANLAASGVVFLDAYSHAPWTRVSVPSLVTSLHPMSHNLRAWSDRLPNAALTLAEVYREAGWATVGFSSIPHTSHAANMHQGYESLYVARSEDQYFAKTARGFTDQLLPWLERHQDQRFFVFFHVFDPHFPYEPRPPYDTLWTSAAQNEAHRIQMPKVSSVVTNMLKASQGMATRQEMERSGTDTQAYIETRQGHYDASIRAMDEELGRIVERLSELGLEERTLVAFTSDHGEEFLEHDWMGHGHSLYNELIHVPLFFWNPSKIPARVVETPVQHLDVLPTLLELSGLAIPQSAQGQSMIPLWNGTPGWRDQPIVSERPGDDHLLTPPPREYSSESLIFDGWKLIYHGSGRGELPEFELYDHEKDPGETRDLAADHPEIVKRLAGLLETWRLDAVAKRLPNDADAIDSLSDKELERLRSLGYIQ